MDNIDENIKKINFFGGRLEEKVCRCYTEKRIASIECFTLAEQKKIAELLESKQIYPTGSDIGLIYALGYSEIATRISILEEIHELDVYREDPSRIIESAIDIHKKIRFCIINNIPYREPNGKYKNFLFRKGKDEWNKVVERVKQYKTDETIKPVTNEKLESKPGYEIDLGEIHDKYDELNAAKAELSKMRENIEPNTPNTAVTAKGQYDDNFYDIINGELNEISFADKGELNEINFETETFGGRS